MAAKYADEEITQMIAERTPLPEDYRSRVQLRDKRGHKERELDVVGENKGQYCLILRPSNFHALDFSMILAVSPRRVEPFCVRLSRWQKTCRQPDVGGGRRHILSREVGMEAPSLVSAGDAEGQKAEDGGQRTESL